MYSPMRTREEIDTILDAAKLDRKDLLPLSQEIMFDCKFSGSDLRLIELSGHEVMEALKIGSSLVFRGDVNDAAVLCTDSSTFEIKEAETSNSLLLMENLAFPDTAENPSPNSSPLAKKQSPCQIRLESNSKDHSESILADDSVMDLDENLWVEKNQILSIAHSYFELKKIRPNLSRINTLLFSSKYKGPEYEPDQAHALMTFEDLLEKIPASSQEIKDYLQLIRAFEMNGSVRLIEEEYLFRVLSQVLACIEENSWRKDNIEKNVVMHSLESFNLYPQIVLENIFQWFFTTSSICEEQQRSAQLQALSSEALVHIGNLFMDNIFMEGPPENLFSIKENEMCRFLGEILLKPVGRFNLKDFLQAWQDSVPEGLTTHLKQLDGLAVYDTEAVPALIWHFPEYNLPDSPAERFAMLFDTKPKWKQEEIIPFVQNVVASVQSVGALLNKFSRVTTVKGVKYYSTKHSK